ncbi:MAG: GxxExxY protein [Candidatus Sumerlaeia bacterium]
MHENRIAQAVVDIAYRLHCALAPGVYENVFETILEYELKKMGFECQRQLLCPIKWDDLEIRDAYKMDMLVGGKVILEIKSVEKLEKVHFKQLTTYLKLSEKKLGLLMNFGEEKINIKRIVNGLDDE